MAAALQTPGSNSRRDDPWPLETVGNNASRVVTAPALPLANRRVAGCCDQRTAAGNPGEDVMEAANELLSTAIFRRLPENGLRAERTIGSRRTPDFKSQRLTANPEGVKARVRKILGDSEILF